MKKLLLIVTVFLLIGTTGIAQPGTNRAKLQELSERFEDDWRGKRAQAEAFARARNLAIRQELPNGQLIELQFIENNIPVYYTTENLNAAITTRVDELWSGGSLGLSLDGTGYVLGEWDGGGVLASHQEFTNTGSSRVTQMDAVSGTHYHATHVAGTMIAGGVRADAIGMAYNGSLNAWDWNSDNAEMAGAAGNGLEVSNHSYGYIHGWYWNGSTWVWYGDSGISSEEDYRFGFYSTYARDWDQIAYDAPYYLIIKSAGNDRGDGPTNGAYPQDGAPDGYDCIGTQGTAKNILTVGAVDDVLNYTGPASVTMSSFSSWGPVDDGRIKPDIVTNGVSLTSAYNSNNSSYASMSGTSMAAPNATGTLALLQQHYQNTHGGSSMRAATLKALVIHSADETGPTAGPDYMFGWGLMNAEQAATLITNDETDGNLIDEQILANGGLFTRDVDVDGSEPLTVTVVWTDPAGAPVANSLDPGDTMLVNDLDLRILGNSTTYFPWKLNGNAPSAAATQNSENNTDNAELVYIANPTAGTYTIQIDHDGTLSSDQHFSIIISGITTQVVPPQPPVANFAADKLSIFSGETVQFSDLSSNSPTSWAWTFSGGTPASSNEQYPLVSYDTPGVYSVSLTVSNEAGSDSKIITDYITVTVYVPEYCDSHGNAITEWISSVSLGSQTNASGSSGAAGYEDLTSVIFDAEPGQTYSLTLVPGFADRNKFEYWSIWIDYNHDFDFDDAGEQVFTASKKRSAVEGSISIPTGVSGQTRMRISMNRSGLSSPCTIFSIGEVEDYTINLAEPVPLPPVAEFSADKTTVVIGGTAQFSDLSQNTPTSWSWSFSGGTPNSSTNQNPAVVYNSLGTYDVSLTATNGEGSDSQTKTGYITVIEQSVIDYCVPLAINNGPDYINSVLIGSTSSNTGQGSNGYMLYEAPIFSLTGGQSFSVTLSPFNSKTRNFWRIWIDFNQDGDFLDADEAVYTVNNKKGPVSGTISIPVYTGQTRMRIAMRTGSAPAPCDDNYDGEVEDYTVDLGAQGAKDDDPQSTLLGDKYKLKIYPNPASTELNIQYSAEIRNPQLRIYSAQGVLLMEKVLTTNHKTIDISHLSTGLYHVVLLSEGLLLNDRVVIR